MNSLEITISVGNIRQGHFYIDRDTDLIPSEYWGGRNKAHSGLKAKLRYEGSADHIETDFDGTKRMPRFGRRQCRNFYERYEVNVGDTIYLNKLSDGSYLVGVNKVSRTS